MAEITKQQLVERERQAWKELSRNLDFLVELVSAKADQAMIKEATAKVQEAHEKYKPLFRQRNTVEFSTK